MPPFMTNDPSLQPRPTMVVRLPAFSAGAPQSPFTSAKLSVSSVTISQNVAALGARMVSGHGPQVGQRINVSGTTVGGAAVNRTSAAIIEVDLDALGIEGLSYACLAPDLAKTPDTGEIIALVDDEPEPLFVGAYQQFALDPAGAFEFTFVWGSPTPPDSIEVQFEASIDDIDADYESFGYWTVPSGTEIMEIPKTMNFVRAKVLSASGTDATFFAKIFQAA
jgi:hypothetical protein